LVAETITELLVWEITKPATIHDSVMFISISKLLQSEFHYNVKAVMGDGTYDTASIIRYILNTLKAKPRISIIPRNDQQSDPEKERKRHPNY